jgi:hypothetical protein
MKWKALIPKDRRIRKMLKTVDNYLIFPANIYLSRRERKIQIEGISFVRRESYITPVFDSCEIFGNEILYFLVTAEQLEPKHDYREEHLDIILTRNLFVKFIIEVSFYPFYVFEGAIFVSNAVAEELALDRLKSEWIVQELSAELDVEKFLDSNEKLNLLLVFLDKLRLEFPNEYQREKFQDATRALTLAISRGFPCEKVIDLRKSRIIDKDLRSKVMNLDKSLGIENRHLYGNPEKMFCRLVRFCLRKIVENNEEAMKLIFAMGTPEDESSIQTIYALEDEISRVYVKDFDKDKYKGFRFVSKEGTMKEKQIICTSFVVEVVPGNMRGTEEAYRLGEFIKKTHMMNGLEYQLTILESLSEEKGRFRIIYCGEIDTVRLVETLMEVKTILSRVIDTFNKNVGRMGEDLITYEDRFWLKFIEFQVERPSLSNSSFEKRLNERLADLDFEKRLAKYTDFRRKRIKGRIRLGFWFPQYFDVYAGIYVQETSEYDSYPLLLKKAIQFLLNGDFERGIGLLKNISLLLYVEEKIIRTKGKYDPSNLSAILKNVENEYGIDSRLLVPSYYQGKTLLCRNEDDVKALNKIVEFLVSKEREFCRLYSIKMKILFELERGISLHSPLVDSFLRQVRIDSIVLRLYSRRDLGFLEKLIGNLYLLTRYDHEITNREKQDLIPANAQRTTHEWEYSEQPSTPIVNESFQESNGMENKDARAEESHEKWQ